MNKLVLLVLVFVLIAISIGCQQYGLTDEQRAEYIELAKRYEAEADAAQLKAVKLWNESLEIQPLNDPAKAYLENVRAMATSHDKLAEDLREKAYQYRKLASE
jgi:hypothetical protein